MADEPKPERNMKEEQKKTEKSVETKAEKPVETPTEIKKVEEKKTPERELERTPKTQEKKVEDRKTETPKKEEKKQVPKAKKTEAIVNPLSLPISTKDAIAICRFIKNKKIEDAINDLEQVVLRRKAVPMKGEIPHRKGKRMMSGRFPKKTAEYFIILLKTLSANSNINELEEPIIIEAVANLASRPYGRFGRTKKKRTHVKIKVEEKK